MLTIPLDVIGEHICKHLSFRDLGRAMQVNHDWLKIFISDHCYVTKKRQVLQSHPNLQKVFDRFPWPFNKRKSQLRPSKAKKRKKVWVIPRGGTRYVFKNWIRGITNRKRFKELYYRKSDQDMCNIIFEEWLRTCFNYFKDYPDKVDIQFIKKIDSTHYFSCNNQILEMYLHWGGDYIMLKSSQTNRYQDFHQIWSPIHETLRREKPYYWSSETNPKAFFNSYFEN